VCRQTTSPCYWFYWDDDRNGDRGDLLKFEAFHLHDDGVIKTRIERHSLQAGVFARYANSSLGKKTKMFHVEHCKKYKKMSIESLKKAVRNIPDFPIQGIQFKDITTLFQSADHLKELSEILFDTYKERGITKVVGIESRGFFMGPAVAIKLGAGFVPIRKPGKLPYKVIEERYTKEYGEDAIQIHEDALTPDDVVLIHDDLLATGGTMVAAHKLVKKLGVKEVYINFLIELEGLGGRKQFPEEVEVLSMIKF
jgi:adenine phosphoribosyltransferase